MTSPSVRMPDLPPFARAIATRLQQPLPGRAAHRRATPSLSYGRHYGPPAYDAIASAVLIAVFARHGQWRTTLTRRAAELKAHAGQICFPGGRQEDSEDSWQCALREWHEELGPPPQDWTQLGQLTPIYVFNSNHLVRPHVVFGAAPEYAPNADEVAEVLEAPLNELCDRSRHGSHWIRRWTTAFETPHVHLRGQHVWGATAIVLSELVAVIDDLGI